MELEIRGKGLTELALETPDFVRAKNATDIASQVCVNISYITSDVFFKGKFISHFFLIKQNENSCQDMIKASKCELFPTDQIQTVGGDGESQLHQCCRYSRDYSRPAGQEPFEPGILSEEI